MLVQPFDFPLAQQLVVGFGFLGRDLQLPEGRLEDAVPGELKQVAETPFPAVVLVGQQAAPMQDLRRLAFRLSSYADLLLVGSLVPLVELRLALFGRQFAQRLFQKRGRLLAVGAR